MSLLFEMFGINSFRCMHTLSCFALIFAKKTAVDIISGLRGDTVFPKLGLLLKNLLFWGAKS